MTTSIKLKFVFTINGSETVEFIRDITTAEEYYDFILKEVLPLYPDAEFQHREQA